MVKSPFGHFSRLFCTSRLNAKSEKLWLERQHRDPYVKAAARLNYRARSAFKLIAIDDKFKIFAPGQIVLDCGAAPGSWSQVAVQRLRGPPEQKAFTVRQLITAAAQPVGYDEAEISDFRSSPKSGLVVGFDLASILPLRGASFLSKADIFDPSTRDRISHVLKQHQKLLEDVDNGVESTPTAVNEIWPRCVDVVMSDMAPNASGQYEHDVLNICQLARGAYDLASVFLKPGGSFMIKLWDSPTTNVILDQLGRRFDTTRRFKPEGSRTDSSEIFVVALGFKSPGTTS